MFGNESQNTDLGHGQTSIIANGCKCDGKFEVQGSLRVEGELEGDVHTSESLVIGKTGIVNSTVNIKNAVISGKFSGIIVAEDKIELKSGSSVEGDIITKRLVISDDVSFEGKCTVGKGKTEFASSNKLSLKDR